MRILKKIQTTAKEKLPYLMIGLLLFLMLFFYLFNRIVITIGAGEAGVLWRRFHGGTVVDKVYAEGTRLILPWDRMHVYNVRVQQNAHEFYVLTRNGLKIDLAISMRYHPEYLFLGVLHKKVGPNYLQTIVIPEIENVLRVLLGRLDAEQVYRTEKAVVEKAVNEAIDQIARRFVRVDDVIIKMVRLPDTVERAIQEKMTQKHLADAYDFKLLREEKEARRKAIEAEGLKRYNDIVGTSLSGKVLEWLGIKATLELARSENAKVVVVGGGEKGLPIIGAIPMAHGQEDVLTGPPIEKKGAAGLQSGETETVNPVGGAAPDTAPSPVSTAKTGNHEAKQ